MHIWYTAEKGFGWSEAAIAHKQITPLYKEWGEVGMHYLCNFSHPLSPHSYITDLTERNESVIEEMRSLKIGIKQGNAWRYPKAYNETKTFRDAEEALLTIGSVPSLNQVAHLKRKLTEYHKKEDEMKWADAEKDPDLYNKQLNAIKNLRSLINDTAKSLAEAETTLQKQCMRSGLISLDQIWNSL